MKKKGFFQDANGDLSMMRLLVFIIVVASMTCMVTEITYCIFTGKFEKHHLGQILAFATLGLGSKWAQKQTEK